MARSAFILRGFSRWRLDYISVRLNGCRSTTSKSYQYSFPLLQFYNMHLFGIPSCMQRRFKYKKSHKEEDDANAYELDYDSGQEEAGSKVITGYMTSLRADLVLKTGLGISRNKIETLFYESKIRVNGSKILKKSYKVNIGDELDIIKGPSPINDQMLIVSRVLILSTKMHDDEDKLVVKMRRFKSLTIENT